MLHDMHVIFVRKKEATRIECGPVSGRLMRSASDKVSYLYLQFSFILNWPNRLLIFE